MDTTFIVTLKKQGVSGIHPVTHPHTQTHTHQPPIIPGNEYKSAELCRTLAFKRNVADCQIKSFQNQDIPLPGKYYDLRVYTDAEGTDWYPYVFGKTLQHDPTTGFVKKVDVDKIITALQTRTLESLEDIPRAQNAGRNLEGVFTSLSYVPRGFSPAIADITAPFNKIESVGSAFEMAEVYGMSLLRDVPFFSYDNTDSTAVISGLNMYTNKTTHPLNPASHITSGNLFRGPHPGELAGPYISQFLVTSFNYGNIRVEQKFLSEPDADSSISHDGWLAIQNGMTGPSMPPPPMDSQYKYCYSGRVLGSKVHNDPLFQFYYNAALIALENGISPSGFSTAANTSDWTDSGAPDIFSAVADVAHGALRTAWNLKYNTTMRIRPEVHAQRIQFAHDDANSNIVNNVPGLSTIYNNIRAADSLNENPILQRVLMNNESLYLKLQYQEGSPTHPSLPAGHAVVAGACCTVLKAMLTTHEDNGDLTVWADEEGIRKAQHSLNGDDLVLYDTNNEEGVMEEGVMTVVGELNKLESNVSLGRDFAGVHARSDGHCGMLAGEEFAISYLVDRCKEMWTSRIGLFEGYVLNKFDGSNVRITSEGVFSLSSADFTTSH